MITVVVAEDHPIPRRSIRELLKRAGDMEIVGEAADGAEAFALIKRQAPDVLVTDIFMPNLSGLDLIHQVNRLNVPTRIVAISMYTDESLIVQAFKVGAHAYISKRKLAQELLPAIRAVFQSKDETNAPAPNG